MMDIGVAKPRAHGHAIMRTATALTMACANVGSGPSHIQIPKVIRKQPGPPARRCPRPCRRDLEWAHGYAGLRDHVHDLSKQRVTTDTLGAHDETSGTINRTARDLIADGFSTGERFAGDHRLFTLECPSTTAPSTGTLSPGTTRNQSPTFTWSRGTS